MFLRLFLVLIIIKHLLGEIIKNFSSSVFLYSKTEQKMYREPFLLKGKFDYKFSFLLDQKRNKKIFMHSYCFSVFMNLRFQVSHFLVGQISFRISFALFASGSSLKEKNSSRSIGTQTAFLFTYSSNI